MMTCEDVPIRSENVSASPPTAVLLQQPLQYLTLPGEFGLDQEGGCGIVQLPDGSLAQAIPISLFCVPASAIAVPVVPSRVWSTVYNSNDKPEDNQQVHDYSYNSPPALNENCHPNQRPPPQSVRRATPGLQWRVTGDNEPQTTTTTFPTEKQCLFKRAHAPTNVSAFAMGLACCFMPLYTRTQRFIGPNIASCGGQSIIGGSGSQSAELGQLPQLQDDNQPTYYIIAAPPKPKRQRQARPTAGHQAHQDPKNAATYSQATNSTILTPATTPPQHPYLIPSNVEFLNLEDCVHTQIPTGYLSPPESSLSASPYGSAQNSDTCSSVVSSAPVTPFYECISPEVQSFGQDQWQDWIDEIVEEVQSEIKAESNWLHHKMGNQTLILAKGRHPLSQWHPSTKIVPQRRLLHLPTPALFRNLLPQKSARRNVPKSTAFRHSRMKKSPDAKKSKTVLLHSDIARGSLKHWKRVAPKSLISKGAMRNCTRKRPC
ncbi:hypothetical protein DdX_04996 [Ditylenchus destructor]|uniref:Uncharacterized protein n=1 Tax=Ditylenchus destructor TaxID=166010 RepID=A0AAD4NDG5_9BILA|nr:hypothetical protein DdX_04996 [Ditylenchus destructor]